jgi:hypothetical protein
VEVLVNYESGDNSFLTVAPNPAYGFIFITTNVAQGEYELYNILGDKVASGMLSSTGRTRVDISGLSPGIYNIRTGNELTNESTTIIIQQK